MDPLPSPRARSALLAALVLLSLTASMPAPAQALPSCSLANPASCCDVLGLQCDLRCDLTRPETCCPPELVNCPPVCDLSASITECCKLIQTPTPILPPVCCPPGSPNPLPPCFPPRECVWPPGGVPEREECCQREPGADGVPCPDAFCVAVGVLVLETDALGGTSRNAFAESRAWVRSGGGPYTAPPGPAPMAPPNAMAHGDAQLVGLQYANGLVGVDASTVHSRCDVDAGEDPAGGGLFTDAYGRGGVQDLEVTLLGNTVWAEAADFELQAFGTPPATTAAWACDVAELGTSLTFPNTVAAVCNNPSLNVNVPFVGYVVHPEVNGPTFDPGTGLWVYEGALLHIHLDPLSIGAATIDIYVGYVQVGVEGGPAAPPTYTPNGPCVLLPLCS